ncbi:hypothetical protein BD408DRAFT_440039 [Parasitella parasitica]|nr:hypothetical protein BD408DRAFT_440039 [Parasitella parasitica]
MELKAEIAKRLSCFGDVLDHGISKNDGIFQGEGYATLNLTLTNTPDNECQEPHAYGSISPGHKHLESLAEAIIWDPRDEDQREVLLQCDKMPEFYRNISNRNGSIDSASNKILAVDTSSVPSKSHKGYQNFQGQKKTDKQGNNDAPVSSSAGEQDRTSGLGSGSESPGSLSVNDSDALQSISKDYNKYKSPTLCSSSPELDIRCPMQKQAAASAEQIRQQLSNNLNVKTNEHSHGVNIHQPQSPQ